MSSHAEVLALIRAIRQARDEETMRSNIEQIRDWIDKKDKAQLWSLVAYVLDHGRFYDRNAEDVARLKTAVLASTFMTRKMKRIVQAHTGPKSSDHHDEHLLIGSETYDHED